MTLSVQFCLYFRQINFSFSQMNHFPNNGLKYMTSKIIVLAKKKKIKLIVSSTLKHRNPVDMSAYSYELSTVHTSLSAKDAY